MTPKHALFTALATLLAAAQLGAQQPTGGGGTLFPQAFVVEHHLIQDDGDGSVLHGDTVTDYYGGSWIVSVRPDGSRMVVDLARRELTEVRPDRGSYWTLSFGRFSELKDRLAELHEPDEPDAADLKSAALRPELTVVESAEKSALATVETGRSDGVWRRDGVRHLRIAAKSSAAAAIDVWVDGRVRLGPAALDALVAFEGEVLGPPAAARAKRRQAISPSLFVDAARRHGDGAFPVRTVRPLAIVADRATQALESTPIGSVEDLATRLDVLDTFPLDLVRVPEGLRRTASPLETMVAFAEQDAAIQVGAPTDEVNER